MARYGTFIYGDGTLYGDGSPVFPIPDTDRVPWVFSDPVNDDSYEFAINPLNATFPTSKRTVTTQYTTSGKPVNFEGRSTVKNLRFSGTILHEEHYNAMVDWANKSSQVHLKDDLGRGFWVVITNFSPTRRYHRDYPWRHEFSVDAVVVSWE